MSAPKTPCPQCRADCEVEALQHTAGSQLGCPDCVYRHKESQRDRVVMAPGSLGCLIFLGGGASVLLALVGLNFKLLAWIDAWGTETGWSIRGAICLFGVALLGVSFVLGKVLPKPKKPEQLAS